MSSAYYKRVLSVKKRELREYNKRKNELYSILGDYPDFDDNANDMTNLYKKAERYIQSGIKIVGGSNDAGDLWSRSEQGSWDGNLSESRSHIRVEINRVENKISDIECEMSGLSRTIYQEEAMEEREAREAKEKAAKKA